MDERLIQRVILGRHRRAEIEIPKTFLGIFRQQGIKEQIDGSHLLPLLIGRDVLRLNDLLGDIQDRAAHHLLVFSYDKQPDMLRKTGIQELYLW